MSNPLTNEDVARLLAENQQRADEQDKLEATRSERYIANLATYFDSQIPTADLDISYCIAKLLWERGNEDMRGYLVDLLLSVKEPYGPNKV